MSQASINGEGSGDSKAGGAAGWSGWLGPLVTTLAIALAAFLLYRALSRYSFDELVASVASVPGMRLLAAGGFAAASYVCLTGFDFLALRYVGHSLPYPRVAVASFVSLSLGHNIGLAALSAGAVRYRFYSRWGLTAGEVAKVILFCGLTVGVGLVALGGAAVLLRPGLAAEITGLPQPAILALGGGCMLALAIYLLLAAAMRKPLRFRQWSLETPSLRLAIGQIVVGSVNFACVAACLHQALLGVADVDFLGVASVYVIANIAAMFSHVPGGLGVIESVVLYLLPQADLVGALLVFRFVYYLVPLALGGALFGLAELVFRMRGRQAAKRES